jgi:hypothetical protein
VIPWLDQPPPFPGSPDVVATQLVWEELGAELTPNEKFFTVQHYGPWLTIREQDWRLAVDGLAVKPRTFTLAELRARPRQQVTFTLECSGNHGFPFFTGGIGTAVWAGTPLAPLLRELGWQNEASEVTFWGADAGPGPAGDQTVVEQFARSMSLAEALDPNLLLCYEMNGVPLHNQSGALVGAVAVIQDLRHLREVERMKSDFVALVSHELRTPLAAIKGAAESLLRRAVPWDEARWREYVELIDGQSDRLHELIDNLLSLSQVEAVSDEGPGIPPAERERVFERFYQIARPHTRNVGGSGLGLAICKALVEAHGGRIWADEAPGGARLLFTLPALVSEGAEHHHQGEGPGSHPRLRHRHSRSPRLA